MTKHQITVTLDNSGKSAVFDSGLTALEALTKLNVDDDKLNRCVAVYVNNEIQSLTAPLVVNAHIKPLTLDMHEGRVVYRSSLTFLLAAAAARVFPDKRLIVGHSLGNGYYYYFEGKTTDLDLQKLSAALRELVDADAPIHFRYLAYGDAVELFVRNGQSDTKRLLEGQVRANVPVYECCGFSDLAVGALVWRTGLLQVFELFPYQDGFLLRYPTSSTDGAIGKFEDIPRLFSVYKEYKQWGRIVRIHSAGELNHLISGGAGGIKDFIRVAEAFHAKKLAAAAEIVYELREDVKVLLIAGPSSSGKTTTAKRLAVQLMVLGFEPLAVSLDNYYNPPDMAPKDEFGQPDLECIEALDVPYLNEQLNALLSGREITLPVYDFKTNTRRSGKTIRIADRTVIIIEGIHGLNERLTEAVPHKKKWKLYVSPLTQLNLDDHNRVPTSDNRLVRRIVRDYQFRGVSAAKTLSMWSSVRRGELKYIFPFQNGADFIFNSALDYELPVLKFYAEPLLRAVKPTEPEFAEASRLLGFLENFMPILPQNTPPESILREFIGGSDFKY